MRTIVGISAALLLAGTAHAAEIDGASCSTDISAAQETFDAIMAARPKTVIDPHSKVSLCSAPPTVRFDAALSNPVISLSIPLASMKSAPLSPDELGKEIAGVRLPAPWGEGETSWSVKNGAIQIQAPTWIGAWEKINGEALVTLKSGQMIAVDVSSPSLTLDLTANHLGNLAGSIDAKTQTLAFENQQLERMKSWAADPSKIPFRSEAARTTTRADLAKANADIATLRPQLQKSWDATSAVNHLAVYLSIGAEQPALTPLTTAAATQNNAMVHARESAKTAHDLLDQVNALVPPLPEDQLATFRQDAATADASLAKTTAAYQSTTAAIDSAIAQNHLQDAVLARAQAYFSPDHSEAFQIAMRMRDNDIRDLAKLDQMAANERAQMLASLVTEIPRQAKENAAAQAEIDGLKAELAAGAPIIRTEQTGYDSGCPRS